MFECLNVLMWKCVNMGMCEPKAGDLRSSSSRGTPVEPMFECFFAIPIWDTLVVLEGLAILQAAITLLLAIL